MSGATYDEAKAFLANYFAEPLRAIGRDGGDLPDNFDFLIEGVMDSLGLLEMISALESRFGVTLDLEALDAEELTQLGPLCRAVVEKAEGFAG